MYIFKNEQQLTSPRKKTPTNKFVGYVCQCFLGGDKCPPPIAYAFGRMLRRLDAPKDLGRELRFEF